MAIHDKLLFVNYSGIAKSNPKFRIMFWNFWLPTMQQNR